MLEINLWHLVMLFFGFWWGSFITTYAYKRAHQKFIDEIHSQYRLSLQRAEAKCRKECDTRVGKDEFLERQLA